MIKHPACSAEFSVLVATSQAQGVRSNDFDYCVDGELVRLFEPCARDRRDPDGGCGCGRAFGGLSSHRATTTAMVVETSLTEAEYAAAIDYSLDTQGYGSDPEASALEARDLIGLVADWPVGAIIERRLDELRVRALRAA